MTYLVRDDPEQEQQDEQDPQDPRKPKPYVVSDDPPPSAQAAPYKVTDDTTPLAPAPGVLGGPSGTPGAGRGATPLPADHPAAQPGLLDRFANWYSDHFATPSGVAMNPAAAPGSGVYTVPENQQPIDPKLAAPTDRRSVTEQASQARAQGAQVIRSAASADVSGTPGAQIVPAPRGGTTTAAALDASQTMAAIQTQADQQQQFSPQEWMKIAKRGMEMGSALHARGEHEAAQDVLKKAYVAQQLAIGAKDADTPQAIALSNMLGIFKDPYAVERKNLAMVRSNPEMTFTPEEQQTMLGRNVPVSVERPFDPTKDIAAPLIGQLPLFELGGFAGRGAMTLGSMAAERAGYEGIGAGLGRLAQTGEEAAQLGPRVPVRTGPLARTRLSEEVAALRQQLPEMVGRGATQGQIVGGVSTYRQARQQGATPEQALAAVAEGMAMQVPMGVAAEVTTGLAGKLAGFGYDPIGRFWRNTRNDLSGRFRPTTPEEAVTSFHPEPTPTVDAARAQMGKLPTADMMPGMHRDIASGLEDLLGQRRAETQARYEDIFAPRGEPRPAGPDFWENLPPEDVPRTTPGDRALGPEEAPASMIERPANRIGREPAPAPEPLPTAREAALRRAGIEPGVRPIDDANAHVRMGRAHLDAEEAARSASAEAQAALNDPNLRLELAAQAAPGEKQGPLTLAQTLARAGREADAGEPLATEYKQAINNYADAAAAVRDAGEGGPNTRAQIAMARAKAALDVARTKYGKQIGASAVLALAANDSDLDDEEKKMVGLAGIGILATDVAKLGDDHPLMQRVSFRSRLAATVDKMPKAWDAPRPAIDWIGKLKGTNTFKKEELALILPALEEAQRNKVKLSRDDLRAIMNEKLPEIKRVLLADEGADVTPGTSPDHPDPDDIDDLDDIQSDERATNPDYLQQQIANRRAARDNLQERIDREIEEARDSMEYHNRQVDQEHQWLINKMEEFSVDPDVLDPAIEFIRENTNSDGTEMPYDYEARRQRRGDPIDHAVSLIHDNLYEAAAKSPEDLLQENGYTVEEEGEQPPERKKWLTVRHRQDEATHAYILNSDLRDEGLVPHRVLDDGRHEETFNYTEGHTDAEHIAGAKSRFGPDAEVTFHDNQQAIDEFEPSGEHEWVVRDGAGREIARDADRDEAMQEAANDQGLEPDLNEIIDKIKTGLYDYASALARWNEYESTYYHLTDGEGHADEYAKINEYGDEIRTLTNMHDEAAQQQANAPAPTETAPAPEGEQPEVINPMEPSGPTKWRGTQMISGLKNYREILMLHPNKPGEPYIPPSSHAYREHPNYVVHTRGGDMTVRRIPDITGPDVVFHSGEPEDIRIAKSEIVKKRKARDEATAEANAIAEEYERLPRDKREDYDIQQDYLSRYNRKSQQAKDLALREDELADRLANLQGSLLGQSEPPPIEVAMNGEVQSDYAQKAGEQGIKQETPPAPPEEIARLQGVYQEASERYDRLSQVVNEAGDRFSKAEQEYNRLTRRSWGDDGERNAERYAQEADAFNMAVRRRRDEDPTRNQYGQIGPYEDEIMQYIPSPADANNPYYGREFALLRQVAPELVPLLDEVSEAMKEHEAAVTDQRLARQASVAAYEALKEARSGKTTGGVPGGSPYISGGTKYDPKAERWDADGRHAVALGAAGWIADAAERGMDHIAFPDASTKVRNASMKLAAADTQYGEKGMVLSGVRRLMASVGFPDIKFDKMYIRGEAHWHFELTREMRDAIKKLGFPTLAALALMATPKSEAGAEEPGQQGAPSRAGLYGTAVGGIVAGAAVASLVASKRGRRLLKENDELRTALMMDDLAGLSNKTAFHRAIPSVDADETHHWVVFDGDRFKKMNDAVGHSAGDRAIQHFGKTIRTVAEDMNLPMRGFRAGGDEFAFAAPAEHAAEFQRRVEERSSYTEGGVETKLTGGSGPTQEVADAQLRAAKDARRAADPSLRRTPLHNVAIPETLQKIVDEAADKAGLPKGQGMMLYSNPIGPALKELAKYPTAASIAAVGGLATQSDDPDIRATGKPLLALAALSAIGSRRIGAATDFVADRLLQQMQKVQVTENTNLAQIFNPDALLHPDVRAAILDYEKTRAKGQARANEFSGKSKALGPKGDRAVSDVIENEGWEDTSQMSGKDLNAVLTVAASLQGEYDKLAQEKVATGVLDPGQLLPDYAGPRRYAHYEAQDVLAERRGGGTGSKSTRIGGQKSRTLDEPIRDAQRALDEATQAGDPQAIQAAQDALDQAKVVQMSQRTERGEIRESSYRAAQGIEKGYADVAAAKLFQVLRSHPDVAHPDWVSAIDDLRAAKQLRAQAKTPADRQAADDLIRDAKVKVNDITTKFQKKGGDYVSLPDTPGLGALRGAVVQRDVANSLQGFASKGLYGKTLRAWKNVKTIFNPGTHAANILSNIAFAHMEGVPMWQQPMWLKRAADDMRRYGPMTRALTEAGVLGHNAVNAEGTGTIGRSMKSEAGLAELNQTTRPETQDVLNRVAANAPREAITAGGAARASRLRTAKFVAGGAALGAAKMYDDEDPGASLAEGAALGAGFGAAGAKFGERIRRTYGSEDDIFRIAIGMKKMDEGMSLADATRNSTEALGNFRTRSPALNLLRSSVAPFILYPAKVLPRFGAQVVDHPWRWLTLMALWGGLNEYSQKQEGDVPDIDVPPGQRRLMGYFMPGFTQLPMHGDQGEKAAVDIGRWMPTSGLTTGAPPGSIPAALDDRTPDIFRAGGPVVDLAAKFGANIDPFTQKQVYRADYPPRENIRKLLNDVSGTMLPSALDFHATNIKEDLQNQDYDKLKTDALGPTGLRPRFIRPGANARSATFELQQSLSAMKQDLQKDLIANKNPNRTGTLQARYLRRVQQALANYRERLGVEPPANVVHDALTPPPP